ncbi:putative entry exclusion protein TrbK-alt [Aureimonas altamirensis]|uniref:putative entry exclusion protein TrbK-alt n=1 Tax=Aureimonas altamirensis TaxID=370622 RepID=UPI001E351A5C|nr:putative entry exclusion protein TrbK-alt [Aureimonas altamirensis]UHD45750.1 putative entry exclusion protein TrbK-alt [Aureimonas altamirensis]
MDGKMLARLGAGVFIAIAITAAVVEMTREDNPPVATPRPVVEPASDPLREAQRRCQQLGETAAADPECLRVWAETRDRFLGRTPSPTSPRPSERR